MAEAEAVVQGRRVDLNDRSRHGRFWQPHVAKNRQDKRKKMQLLDKKGIWHPGFNRKGREECTIAQFVKIPLIAKALRILEKNVTGPYSQDDNDTIESCLNTSRHLCQAVHELGCHPIRPEPMRLVVASEDDKKTQELARLRSELAKRPSIASIQKLLDVNARLQKLAVDQDAEIKKLRKLPPSVPFQDLLAIHQIASSQLISECVIDGQPCSTFVVEANSPYQMSDSVGKCFTVLTCMLRVTV